MHQYDELKTVKIGPYTYKLIFTEDDKLGGSSGLCDKTNHTIRVTKDGTKDYVNNTIIHEILHAMFNLMDIRDSDGEEQTVTALSTAIQMFIKDNPGISKKIVKLVNESEG